MSKIFYFLTGVWLWILLSAIAVIVFMCTPVSIDWEISIWEIITIVFGIWIAIYVPMTIGQAIENKKDIKSYILEEVDKIELYYLWIEQDIMCSYRCELEVSIMKECVYAKNKHISNKIKQLSENWKITISDLDTLKEKNNVFREDITEKFGEAGFAVNATYIQLFHKCYSDIWFLLSQIKSDILNK